MPKVIKKEDIADFKARKKALKIPRSYVSIVEYVLPGRYSKNQLRDFVNNKTMNFNLLEDMEKIFNK